MQDDKSRKYVFVCGLQRSGTSVLGRNVARLNDCTGFKETGALMDEGQFLQDVYPIDAVYGGAGRFGFHPQSHRTETSELLTPENIARLRASWHAHWDTSKTICVEKTPANLLMTRFLQAVFPNSYFIVMRRHPVPVSLASQRWKVSLSPLHRLLEHWLHCHRLFDEDKKYLRRLYELRYEDYIQNPDKYHQKIATFIGTTVPQAPKEDRFRIVTEWRNPTGMRVPEAAMEQTTGAHNEKYFNGWSELLSNSVFKRYYRYIAAKYESEFTKYGYSLTNGFGIKEEYLRKAGRMSAGLGTLCSRIADACAFVVRLATRSRGYVRRHIREHLPEPIKVGIKRVLRKVVPMKKESEVVSS